MRSARGIISAVQEGRFRLLTDDGRVLTLVLSHKADVEPQDLPQMAAAAMRIRVRYAESRRLIAGVAHRLDVEE